MTSERRRILTNLKRYRRKLDEAIRLLAAEADNDSLVLSELDNVEWGIGRWGGKLRRLGAEERVEQEAP